MLVIFQITNFLWCIMPSDQILAPYEGAINFVWYGNPVADQYKSAAFEGPLSFLRAAQNNPNATLIYWCPKEHKSKVEAHLNSLCEEQNFTKRIIVKSIEDDLLNALVEKSHIKEREADNIRVLLEEIAKQKDFNIGKELCTPLILLLEGGYFFDTTINLELTSKKTDGYLPLPEIINEFGYAFHDGKVIRTYPQLDVYAYAAKKPNSTTVKRFAFLNVETIAKLYDKTLDKPFIDPLNSFPEKNRILDSATFEINEEMIDQFKQLKYKDVAGQEIGFFVFYPRNTLIKPIYYLQRVDHNCAKFTYQVAPTITNAPRFMEMFHLDDSFKLIFRENNPPTCSVMKVGDNITLIKTFGKSGWYHQNPNVSILIKIQALFQLTALITPVIMQHVLEKIIELLTKIYYFIIKKQVTTEVTATKMVCLTLRDKLNLTLTRDDLPNEARNTYIKLFKVDEDQSQKVQI